MVTTVQLDLVVAVVTGIGILAAILLAGNLKQRQWLRNGQFSGQRRLPNYSKLTGFPCPKPIHHFDIDSAKPRPYRPFRWGYHQTMCQSFRR